MISTLTGGGAGPVAGFIATTYNDSSKVQLSTYRKRILATSSLANQLPSIPNYEFSHVHFSPDGKYIAGLYYDYSDTRLYLASRSGLTFTSITVPSNTGAGYITFSSDSTYIASGTRIYHNDNGSLTSLSGASSVKNFINNNGVFAVCGPTPETLEVRKRSGSGNSATYAVHQTISLNTNESLSAAAFSPDGTYFFARTDTSPYVRAYKYNSSTDQFSYLSQPPIGGVLPPSYSSYPMPSWSSDGTLVAVSNEYSGQAGTYIYERSGDTFTYRTILFPQSGTGWGIGSFHPSGNFYIDGSGYIYKKNTASSWSEVKRITSGRSSAFSPYI